MNLREQLQREFANTWLNEGPGILLLAPRFGKTRVAIMALQTYECNCSILIAYPDNKIRKSWEKEFEIMGYNDSNVTYTTHLSLHKYQNQRFDVVILDEIHLLSEAQLVAAYELLKINRVVMGLTGTLAKDTALIIRRTLGLRVIVEYPIEQAIKDGVIADYEISVVTVPLDNKILQHFGKQFLTEKSRFNRLSYVIEDLQENGKDTKFMRFTRMRVFQSSVSKIAKTKELLEEYKDERVLVFCGQIKAAESLGIPCYHSKSSEKKIFEDFSNGIGNQLAVVKIGNTGITYKPLNRVIINYTDSNPENLTQKINRCMSMEYDNPEKKALITIVSTNEDVELNWIKRGLSFFSPEKIKYI
jgi:superfamily II DNA or RNA helicase